MKIAKQLVVRMNYNTFVRLKVVFPAGRKESMSSYFNRLAIHLEMVKTIKKDAIAHAEKWDDHVYKTLTEKDK